MTETNPPQPSDPNGPNTTPTGPKPAPTPPKPRKRRIWPWVIVGFLVLILLLVALIPTIASTGMVRSIVVSKINANLNGHIEISDWSLGWTGGIRVHGVKVFDDQSRQIAELQDASTGLSLLDAIKGKFALGKTTINGLDFTARREADGTLNFAKLAKSGPVGNAPASLTPPASSGPSKLPDISGDFEITNSHGTWEDQPLKQTFFFPSITASIKVPDINGQITDHLDLQAKASTDAAPGQLIIDGTATAIKNNQIDVNGLIAAQQIKLVSFDAKPIAPILLTSGIRLRPAGVADGQFNVSVNTLDDIAASGNLSIAKLELKGAMIHGDRIYTDQFVLNLNQASRKISGSSSALKLDLAVKAQDLVDLTARIDGPQDAMIQAIDLVQDVAKSAIEGKATAGPASFAGAGNIEITANANLKNIAQALRKTLALGDNVAVTSGSFAHKTTIALSSNQVTIATNTDINGVAGTRDGKPITLDDIHASAGLSAVGGDKPDVKNLAVDVKSSFLTLAGGGESLAKLKLDGNLTLQKLQSQAEQFVDLNQMLGAKPGEKVVLAGAGPIKIQTTGDLLQQATPLGFYTDVNLGQVVIQGVQGMSPISEQQVYAGVGGTLKRSAELPIAGVDGWTKVQISNDEKNPTVFIDATGRLELAPKPGQPAPMAMASAGPDAAVLAAAAIDTARPPASSGSTLKSAQFTIKSFRVDLPRALTDFAPVLALAAAPPADAAPTTQPSILEQLKDKTLRINSGLLNIGGSGSYDNGNVTLDAASPLTINLTNLNLDDSLKKLGITFSQLSMNAAGNYTGGAAPSLHLPTDKPLTINISDLNVTKEDNGSPRAVLNREKVDVKIAGDVNQDAETTTINIPALSVNSGSGIIALNLGDQPLNVKLNKGGVPSGTGSLAFQANLKGIVDLLDALSRPPTTEPGGSTGGSSVASTVPSVTTKLDSGAVAGQIHVARDEASKATRLTGAMNGSGLTISQSVNDSQHPAAPVAVMNNEKADVTFDLSAPDTLDKITGKLNLAGALGKVGVQNLMLQLLKGSGPNAQKAGTFDLLQHAEVTIGDVDLARVTALLNALPKAPPAPALTPAQAAEPPAPAGPAVPYDVRSGVMNAAITVSRENGQTKIDTGNGGGIQITNLDLASLPNQAATKTPQTAINTYKFQQPVVFVLKAAITNNPAAGGTDAAAPAIQDITVSALQGNLGPITISIPNNGAIQISHLGAPEAMQASGAVQIDGDLQTSSQLLAVLAGINPGYTGQLHAVQTISKEASKNRLNLTGTCDISKFQVLGKDERGRQSVVLSEDKLSIANNLFYNLFNKSIGSLQGQSMLTIDMASSKALSMQVNGAIGSVDTVRRFQNVQVALSYDLAKVWPIIKPLLTDPADPTKWDDVKIAGQFQKTFTVKGQYPAGQDFHQAIRGVNAVGSIAIQHLEHNGLVIDNMDVPVVLQDGQLVVKNADGSLPPPFACNSGTIAFGGASLDLTTPDMRLSIPPGTHVLNGVALNPLWASKLAVFGLPLLADPKEASGKVDLIADQCDRLPVGNLMTSPTAKNDGQGQFTLNVQQLNVTGGFIGQLLQFAGGDALQGNITNGKIGIQRGMVTSNINLLLGQKGQAMGFNGGVNLANNKFQNFNVILSGALLQKLPIPKEARGIFANGLTAPVTGSANNPQVDIAGAATSIFSNQLPGNLLPGLLNGGQPAANNPNNGINGSPSTQPGQQVDPLQQLLQGLANQTNEKKKKNK